MKEATYGWYPSVKDVYKPKGRPGSYHLECLYKHGGSMYYQGSVAPPQGELFVRGVTNATPPTTPQGYRKSRSVPVPKFSRVPKLNIPTPNQCWSTHGRNLAETAWGVVGDQTYAHVQPSDVSWPLPKGKQQQRKKQQQQQQQPEQRQYQKYFQKQLLQQHIQQQKERSLADGGQTPQYAWGLRPATQEGPLSVRSDTCSSELAWPRAHKPVDRPQTALTDRSREQAGSRVGQKQRPASSPVKSSAQSQKATPARFTPAPPDGRGTSASKRPSRIQSATVQREKTPLPARPLTAASDRPDEDAQQQIWDYDPMSYPPCEDDQKRPPSRPAAPVPFVYDVNENLRDSYEDTCDDVMPRALSPAEDEPYEAILDKYGWRAEVHGDPYRLKRPLKRVSYAVRCEEPEVPPEPPAVHMETNEPFFLNTIPRRPLSFAVDKEWMSEVLLAKRLELQKRDGGVKYAYKNFAFVY
ncbi:translation initiation factor if-2-like [Plakobranchus ocellatus]|uniref:Translation initiation factor if-2-like n=1 Tax=Plakobranchus ocellatus TaxID=259542 RepID=A0AAV3ZYV1_9GAST|nr:translation initiation factor if-2-like [Plakobranchus ocellatus]